MVNYGVRPLDGACERELRAGEHIMALELELANVLGRQAYAVSFELDINPPHHAKNVGLPPQTFFGMRVGILVGEVCYNLRSALDYLTFELAKLDSGTEQSGTQFPIMDAKQDFDGRGKNAFLKGVNAAHVARIESLQPYSGCKWTKTLRDLSNADKHRHFVIAGGISTITVHSGLATDLSRIRGLTFDRKAPHPLTGAEVDVKIHVGGAVTFDNGLPILETLKEIRRNVADLLEAFRPDF